MNIKHIKTAILDEYEQHQLNETLFDFITAKGLKDEFMTNYKEDKTDRDKQRATFIKELNKRLKVLNAPLNQ